MGFSLAKDFICPFIRKLNTYKYKDYGLLCRFIARREHLQLVVKLVKYAFVANITNRNDKYIQCKYARSPLHEMEKNYGFK